MSYESILKNDQELAPIALFVYKRPNHTERVLEYLSECQLADKSDLFIFCDGPKRPQDEEAVVSTREIIKRKQWCKKVQIFESQENKGLANSIINGVKQLTEKYGKVIVLEDDLIPSPNFLVYMNSALIMYNDCPNVMQISGYMFPVTLNLDEDTLFLPMTTSWGWATWKRAWDKLDPEAKGYQILNNNYRLKKKFDLNNSYPFTEMLNQQMKGEIDSWAIRWYWSVFKAKGVCLYPKTSLVVNAGMDGSGTHCGNSGQPTQIAFNQFGDKVNFTFPDNIAVNLKGFQTICSFLQPEEHTVAGKILIKIKSLLGL